MLSTPLPCTTEVKTSIPLLLSRDTKSKSIGFIGKLCCTSNPNFPMSIHRYVLVADFQLVLVCGYAFIHSNTYTLTQRGDEPREYPLAASASVAHKRRHKHNSHGQARVQILNLSIGERQTCSHPNSSDAKAEKKEEENGEA